MDKVFEWFVTHPNVILRMSTDCGIAGFIRLEMRYLIDTYRVCCIDVCQYDDLGNPDDAFVDILNKMYEDILEYRNMEAIENA